MMNLCHLNNKISFLFANEVNYIALFAVNRKYTIANYKNIMQLIK